MVLAKACYFCSLHNLKFANSSFEMSMFVIFAIFCKHTHTHTHTQYDYNSLPPTFRSEGNNTLITPIRMQYVF